MNDRACAHGYCGPDQELKQALAQSPWEREQRQPTEPGLRTRMYVAAYSYRAAMLAHAIARVLL